MKKHLKITDIVLDFDGTCTQIPVIYEAFLAQYLAGLNATVFAQAPVTPADWQQAQQQVRMHSPQAGWTIASTSAAPAAADPYILSFESSQLLLRQKKMKPDVPPEVFGNASKANPAPWRDEAKTVFETLLQHNISITFISNTGSTTITERLKVLLSVTELPKGIAVKSGAEKYRIAELLFDSKIPANIQRSFIDIPAVHSNTGINRPVYLRRAGYFEAICDAFGNDLSRLPTTLFCGDIWEMDLAMPYKLGGNIHLIERAKPFDTYDYERKAVLAGKKRARISEDLNGLLEWIK